jgi:hypothetical protein
MTADEDKKMAPASVNIPPPVRRIGPQFPSFSTISFTFLNWCECQRLVLPQYFFAIRCSWSW